MSSAWSDRCLWTRGGAREVLEERDLAQLLKLHAIRAIEILYYGAILAISV